MTHATQPQRRAFTLLELIMVLAMAAALSGLVLLSLKSHFQQARLSRAIDQTIAADRLARRLAMQQSAPGVQLEFDRVQHAWLLTNVSDMTASRSLAWPATVQIDSPQILGARRWEPSAGAIAYSSKGHSATYYVRLSSGQTAQWLVFLGISGQTILYSSADAMGELLP
jgi:prepilin-type N-terminal cleavage/methylation domain-containing protein